MSDFSFHLFLPEEEAVDGPAKNHEKLLVGRYMKLLSSVISTPKQINIKGHNSQLRAHQYICVFALGNK